jgi:hypothetical protein
MVREKSTCVFRAGRVHTHVWLWACCTEKPFKEQCQAGSWPSGKSRKSGRETWFWREVGHPQMSETQQSLYTVVH